MPATNLKFAITHFLSTLPIVWLVGLLLFYLRARALLGYWPTPNFPDPKLLPLELHHAALALSAYLVVISAPLTGLFFGFQFIVKRGIDHKALVVFALGWFAIGALTTVSLGPLIWFLD